MKGKIIITAILLLASFAALIIYFMLTGIQLSALQADTLRLLVKVYLAACIYCIVASELTGNYSQVDRLWSLIPLAYAWIVAWQDDFSWRPVLCAILISLWGLRLTYNFSLKGGYSWLPWKGEEDYRWAVLRKEGPLSNKWVWSLFNILFITIYQMGLILYFSLPVLLTMESSDIPFGIWDGIGLVGFLVFLSIETIADIQQYRFQTKKYSLLAKGQSLPAPYDKGFIQSGLWAYMRHPNYMAEQMIWLCIYFFSVAATGSLLNWTIGGFILLVLLFRGSSDFSERISASKYEHYKDYQKRVGRFIPKLKI